MNVLITGGAGFIGSNLIPYLLRQARADQDLDIRRLVNFDKLTCAGNAENLADSETDPRYHLIHGDICERATLAKALVQHEIDAVVHLAAESGVDRSIESPDSFVTTNLVGTFQVLEACRAHCRDLKQEFRFIYVSSDSVFGSLDASIAPCPEATARDPASPYAATKAGGEHLVRAYCRSYGFPAVSLTGSSAFGPFQLPENLIPMAIRRLVLGQPVPLHGDGSQTRDWIFVEDFCRGLATALVRGRPGESYHLSARDERQNLDVVRQLISILHALQPGLSLPAADNLIRFLASRPPHDERNALDNSKIRQELGWEPQETFETGLRKTVQWYLDNEDWIEAVNARRQASQPLKPVAASSA